MVVSFSATINSFALDSSFHGINNLFGHRKWRAKVCWALISVIAFSTFFYYSILSYKSYIIEQPLVTNMQYIQNKQVQMPEILVCPVLPNQTYFENFFPGTVGPMFVYLSGFSEHAIYEGVRNDIRRNISAAFEKYPHLEGMWSRLYNYSNLDDLTASFYGVQSSLEKTLIDFAAEYETRTDQTTSSGDTSTLMLNMLPTFKQFFIRCLWKGEDCLNGSNWSTQQTTGLFCHKLTLADSEVYGSFETLQLTFLLDLESASATGKNDLQVELYFLMPGKPFSVQDHKIMTKVGPGYHHDIGLEIFKYDDNSGKTQCLEGNARGVLDFHEEYTYALCVDECVTIKEQSCGCNSLRYARPDDDIPDCGIFDMVICPFDSGVALGQCAVECKPQCSFTTYEIFKKSAKFSSVSSFNTMRTLFRRVNPTLLPSGNLTFDLWRQRVFDVNVHFRSLLSTHISVTLKYSFIDIISAFGGLGGLFIGASLVTLVEICFLLYDLIQAIGGECVLAWGKSRKKKVIPKA